MSFGVPNAIRLIPLSQLGCERKNIIFFTFLQNLLATMCIDLKVLAYDSTRFSCFFLFAAEVSMSAGP